ncbi:hypothetical protein PZA11_006146 [Diplocarpon coronariae]|uniref:Nudix hydrolase domain-containing protein n=1 Tax=Diplocarpon coronariae TaxID=2795749 RepID=A0A218Z4W7_9HELO|nr:hypothetical protein JHW43_001673 [Diplocarpon mali]OWP02256.1 hypothetical protein B2J93_1044 [Marssonina coronariae]
MSERNMHLEDWLDDLCVRFILNLPLADLASIERICFQVEEAQWFYEDFIRPLDPALPSLSLRSFCERIFVHCPLLSAFSQGKHMQAFESFMEYKARVPVRGAILLNKDMDSTILVKGWKKGANWSFPRGKINKDEDDLDCAIREVYEETGYNLEEAGLVPADRKVKKIEVNMAQQQMQLFVFRDVPMETYFEPRTRKEISKIEWWRLSDLPAFRKKGQEHPQAISATKFYMVAPFLVPLRKWVVEQKKKDAKRALSNQYPSAGLSHDEVYTEEDHGAESAYPTHFTDCAPCGMPDQSSLQDASAALNRLLRIQPPQELQAESSDVPQPINKVGDALLAILHSKPSNPGSSSLHNVAPHTPSEHTLGQPQMPPTPQHFPLRSPQVPSMPPPSMFPMQPQSESFSYQQPNLKSQYCQHNSDANSHQAQQPATQSRSENPHHRQSQHLIHPQPLPPNVQRAVFTEGPVHAPMVPSPQNVPFSHGQIVPKAIANPHLPGLRSTMVPLEPNVSPPKLTTHSLALLNAFKTQHRTVDERSGPSDPLQQNNANEAAQSSHTQSGPLPQELPTNASLEFQEPLRPQVVYQDNGNPGVTSPPIVKPAISELQRSTLLGLFKSPRAQAAVPAELLSATALPRSITPSAVELSAVEPLSTNAATTSALLSDKRIQDHPANIGTKLTAPSNSQLPFRPAGILARPMDSNERETLPRNGSGQKSRSIGKKPGPRANHQEDRPEKPIFQPQILKRPQQVLSKASEENPNMLGFPAFSRPSLDGASSHPIDHSSNLLSLFRTGPTGLASHSHRPPNEELISLPPANPTSGLAETSRVGSLASMESGPRRGSQTSISPADRGFLLNYLDAVANGAQR